MSSLHVTYRDRGWLAALSREFSATAVFHNSIWQAEGRNLCSQSRENDLWLDLLRVVPSVFLSTAAVCSLHGGEESHQIPTPLTSRASLWNMVLDRSIFGITMIWISTAPLYGVVKLWSVAITSCKTLHLILHPTLLIPQASCIMQAS